MFAWADASDIFCVVALVFFSLHVTFLLEPRNDPEHVTKLLVSGIMTFLWSACVQRKVW